MFVSLDPTLSKVFGSLENIGEPNKVEEERGRDSSERERERERDGKRGKLRERGRETERETEREIG